MHLLVSLIALPFALVISREETSAPQEAAVRSSLTRSFRHRPPTIITPHVFKVFDARIAVSRSYLMLIVVLFGLAEHVVDFYRSHSSQKAEILGVKSKYRDAERILRGVGLSPLIELPDVYESKGGWKGHIGNSTYNLDPSSNHTFNDMDMHGDGLGAFWIDDLIPPVEDHVSTAGTSSDYPGGKRRCSDEKGGDNGTVCDLAPAGTSGEPGVEARSAPSSPTLAAITPDVTVPNIPLPEPGQNSDQMDSAHMKVMDYIVGGLDVLYYGGLGFGSPSQEIMLDVDTGSADLWVPMKCSSCDTKQFDSEKSMTFKDTGKPFKVNYGSGWAQGTLARDRVTVGNLVVENQYVGAATDVSEDFRGSPASGVLGMAFGSISTIKKPTFFENLLANTQVTAPLFSVHLTRGKEQGSELCIGCINTSKYSGEMYWIPVKSKTYWSVEMTGYSLDGSPQLFGAPITAAIDTGSTLIYLPLHEAETLYEHIPGSRQAVEFGEAIWAFPCSSRLELSLRFGARPFQIHPWDFNLGRTDAGSDECVGGILGLPEGFPSDFAIIGDVFLKSWYSVYDYADNGKIGLAYSTNNK